MVGTTSALRDQDLAGIHVAHPTTEHSPIMADFNGIPSSTVDGQRSWSEPRDRQNLHQNPFPQPPYQLAQTQPAYQFPGNQQQQQPPYGAPAPSPQPFHHPPIPLAPLHQQYAQQSVYPGFANATAPAPSGTPHHDLATRMGAMALSDQPFAPSGPQTHRPAYRQATALGVNPPARSFSIPGPTVSPNPNQFPVPVNPPFNSNIPVSQVEYAARSQFHTLAGPTAATSPHPSSPAAIFAPGQTRLSLEDLPSVPHSRDDVQPYFFANAYPTFERLVPPPAAISFVALDQGNSSPKYARLTMNSIPSTAESLTSTGLPLALLLQPLAPLAPGEPEIPVLDFGETGPPRCQRCRAYINPFMMFRSGGNRFVCNLCTHPNITPPEYFCAITPQGVRLDRERRPELLRGTVEFNVPREYWTREPAAMRWLFLIDVTQESINKRFLHAFSQGILDALYGPEGDQSQDDATTDASKNNRRLPEGTRVGFVTFDRSIHFYNVNSDLDQPHMMVMTDLEVPFVPLHDGLFVDPYESKSQIESLLGRLPAMFSNIKHAEPAFLSALNSALAALEKTGGKIVASLSALACWGPGRLHLRDDGKHTGGEIDKKLFSPELPGWKKVAEKMVAAGVGADLFLAAPSGGYLDTATVGHVSSMSGGETFYYPNFIAERDGARLGMEIERSLLRESGYQVLMKVRCSNGLQISGYHGNFVQHTFAADLEMGVTDADKAFALTFSHDGKLDPKLDAHFQSALLYTTVSGQRRVRCCNVIASVSNNARECLKFVDQDAVLSIMAKEAATKMLTTAASLRDVRNSLMERTIDVMACYRKNFLTEAQPPNQLVMPERLKQFSMYMLGMVKCRVFKGGSETSDRRVHEARMLLSMGASELSPYLYPRILAVHNLHPPEGFPDPATGQLQLPPALRASYSRIEAGGVYLVDNGQQCLLWLHAQTSPNLLQDLFGEDRSSLAVLDPFSPTLPVLPTHLSAQVRNLLEFLRSRRGSKGLTVQLARQSIDGADYEFARSLVEDRNNDAQSYVDWLVHIHKNVLLEISGNRKREDGSISADIGSSLASFTGLRPYW